MLPEHPLARAFHGLRQGRPLYLLAFSALISVLSLSPIVIFSMDLRSIAAIVVLCMALYATVFVDRLVWVVPLVLFIPSGFSHFWYSEWAVLVLAAALLVRGIPAHRSDPWARKLGGFLVFMALTLPSLVHTDVPLISVVSYGHLLSALAASLLVVTYVRTPEGFFRLLAVFAAVTAANSLHILMHRVSGDRFFGFGGVMFIDYAGMGMVGCVTSTFFTKGRTRAALVATAALLSAGLVATQTRNPIPVILGTGLLLAFVAFIKNRAFGISRMRVVTVSSVVLIITTLGGATLLSTDTGLAARVKSSSFEDMAIENALDVSRNTLLTRVLIWDTAINAFRAHPFFGIGAFSFPRVSKKYATINEVLHELYVRNLSPHHGYLMVLCETGIVGLVGFGVFLLSWLRVGLNSIGHTTNRTVVHCRMLALAGTIYVILSLAVTDAWLIGNGAVVLGMVWGLVVAASLMDDPGERHQGKVDSLLQSEGAV